MSKNTPETVITVDLGGTKILSAIINRECQIIAFDQRPTKSNTGIDGVFGNIISSIKTVVNQTHLQDESAAIGICAPGIINRQKGIVYRSPNLPGWENIEIKRLMEKATGRKTFLINDAKAAALGELHYGAAKGIKNCIYLTISTGIGGGIIVGGKLYSGYSGIAGEIGHMVIEPDGIACDCGSRGCWEKYASGTAIAERAKYGITNGQKTKLVELVGGKLEKVNARIIQKAALSGDKFAKELITESACYLAMGFGSLINIFNPEMIIIGGGYARMGKILLKPAFELAAKYSFKEPYTANHFRLAKLGSNSGIIG
ncbi:MAG TPA: ROK family protein, partial [Dehalococcoidales bacterium]|nr:ROK family protein [Dehalococcoidales bacterium]